MWITNPDGLWRLSDGRWRQYRKADGLLSDNPYIATIASDGALWLHHRFDAGIERVEFSGDRLVRSTPVLPADPLSVEVTAFHGFDALGRLWRGSANGVSVLAGGSWTHLSTEDGLIWNDTDGEAFWADPDGSVWIGTSGGLAHYRPPRGGSPAPPVADPVITRLEIGQKAARCQGRILLAQLQERATGALCVPAGRGTLDRHHGAEHLHCRAWPGPASAGDPVAGPRWTVLLEGRRWRSSRSSRSGGKPGGCGRPLFCCRRRRVGRHSVEEQAAAPQEPPVGTRGAPTDGRTGSRNAPRCWKRRGARTRPAKPRADSWQT